MVGVTDYSTDLGYPPTLTLTDDPYTKGAKSEKRSKSFQARYS